MLVADDVLAQVEALQRKVDFLFYFLTVSTTHHAHEAALLLTLLEALQVDDQDWWGLVDLELLGGLYMLLALVAIPFVIFVEDFLLLELSEALINLNAISII